MHEEITSLLSKQYGVPSISLNQFEIDPAARAEDDSFLLQEVAVQAFFDTETAAQALDAGARLLIINAEPTQFDEVADAVIRAPIGEVLPWLCGGKA